MEYEDEVIVCRDCKNDFVWSAGEQKFMHDLFVEGKFDKEDGTEGKLVPPKRCIDCRIEHKKKFKGR